MLIFQCVVTYGFSVWRLDLNVVACAFLEFVGLLFFSCFFVKPASYLRENSNLDIAVGRF